MLTPREEAASAYNAALALGRRRVLGLDSEKMELVTAERLESVRKAARAIVRARDSERHFPREVGDAQLGQMLKRMNELEETLEGDRTRWAAS